MSFESVIRLQAHYADGRLRPHTKGQKNLQGLEKFLVEQESDVFDLVGEFNEGFASLNAHLAREDLGTEYANIWGIKAALSGKKISAVTPLLRTDKSNNEQLEDVRAFRRAVRDLKIYMNNSEQAAKERTENNGSIVTASLREEVEEYQHWSELHLHAIDAEHFVGTVIADLMAMAITRMKEFNFLDSDQLVRAVCETMLISNPDARILRLIFDQGWFSTQDNQFSQEVVASAQVLFATDPS
ncbi:hypothetical protein HY612_02720 [Candidatus Roizmanbacteria bacterium]|nr:hypothetical protein [Candidatus Roizmanbacteria bacterium]